MSQEQSTAQAADDVSSVLTLDSKHWSRSKTLIVNAIVLGLVAAEEQFHLLQPLLPVNVYALFSFALPVINGVLRAYTKQGVHL